MFLSRILVAAAGAAAITASVPARAEVVATLTAAYNAVYPTNDTDFLITNLTGETLTGIRLTTSLGDPTSEALPDLAPGASETYLFSENAGGFINDPAEEGLDDGTTYTFSVTIDGLTLVSDPFSPANNLTGNYVDFLGNTCAGSPFGCTVAMSGVVADVPEPAGLALLGAGLFGMALLRRRSV